MLNSPGLIAVNKSCFTVMDTKYHALTNMTLLELCSLKRNTAACFSNSWQWQSVESCCKENINMFNFG